MLDCPPNCMCQKNLLKESPRRRLPNQMPKPSKLFMFGVEEHWLYFKLSPDV